jgi:hypothetical protein
VLRIIRNVGSLLLASYSFIVDNTTAVAKFSSGIDRMNNNTQGNIVWPYFTGNYSKRGVWEKHLRGIRTNIRLAGLYRRGNC